jgi:hypothetical protein
MSNKKNIENLKKIYKKTVDNPSEVWIKNALIYSWYEVVNQYIIYIEENEDGSIDDEANKMVGELIFLNLSCKDKNNQNKYFNCELIPLLRRLRNNPFSNSSFLLIKSIWESIIIGLDALFNDTIQSIINELNLITNSDIGSSTIRNNHNTIKHGTDPMYFGFLNTAIAKEVISFLEERDKKTISPEVIKLIDKIQSPVISVASRKGGTGKTTFLLNTINWFFERFNNGKACIIDLDLSGPVWLYLLANKNTLNNIKSSQNFLDIFFDTKNVANDPKKLVINTSPNYSEVLSVVHHIKWPFTKAHSKVGLCTFRDLPYTNRLIESALNYNRDKLYPFLINLVAQLSKEYSLIIIDSGPGFSAVPYCSLSIAGIANNSIPAVISTPAVCDIFGTLMEFADLRFVNFTRSPLWWVNKVKGHEYFTRELNWYTLSKDLGISGVLPELPLIENIMKGSKRDEYFWKTLPYDEKIIQVGSIKSNGDVDQQEINCENSSYYRAICRYYDDENTSLFKYINTKLSKN